LDAANATGNAKRNIDDSSNLAYPTAIDSPAIGTRGNVVKNKFVGAILAIALCQFDNIANDTVISKLDAFDYDAITNIKTGNYAFRWNAAISSALIFPSSRARPLIAAGTPMRRSCCMSLM